MRTTSPHRARVNRPRIEHTLCSRGCLRLLILLALCGLLPVGSAIADFRIFRWTDREGHLHFGQVPPATGAYETLRTQAYPTPAAAEPPDSRKSSDTTAHDTRRFLDQAEAAHQAKATEKANASRARQDARQNCQQARQRVQFLEEHTARRLVSTGHDGQPQRIPEDDFLRRLNAAQEAAGTHCR